MVLFQSAGKKPTTIVQIVSLSVGIVMLHLRREIMSYSLILSRARRAYFLCLARVVLFVLIIRILCSNACVSRGV